MAKKRKFKNKFILFVLIGFVLAGLSFFLEFVKYNESGDLGSIVYSFNGIVAVGGGEVDKTTNVLGSVSITSKMNIASMTSPLVCLIAIGVCILLTLASLVLKAKVSKILNVVIFFIGIGCIVSLCFVTKEYVTITEMDESLHQYVSLGIGAILSMVFSGISFLLSIGNNLL